MQSVLQYRRFEKHLRQQVKKHGVDATAGVSAPAPQLANCDFDPATEPKDLEAGPVRLVKTRDHALEEKDRSGQDPEVPQSDIPVGGDLADGKEDLSGSTTRSSSPSTIHSTQPDLRSITTRETFGTSLGQALTGINVRPRRTNEGGHEKGGRVFVVGYVDTKDPLNPHNWSILKRMLITFLVASIGLIVGFASSADSAVIQQARIEFGVSEVTESLATGIYLIGFGCGYARQPLHHCRV